VLRNRAASEEEPAKSAQYFQLAYYHLTVPNPVLNCSDPTSATQGKPCHAQTGALLVVIWHRTATCRSSLRCYCKRSISPQASQFVTPADSKTQLVPLSEAINTSAGAIELTQYVAGVQKPACNILTKTDPRSMAPARKRPNDYPTSLIPPSSDHRAAFLSNTPSCRTPAQKLKP